METGLEEFASLAEKELALNVGDHFGSGGGGKGYDGNVVVEGTDAGDVEIRGTEVVAPLGDAVSLVHGDERYFHLTEVLYEYRLL